MGSMTPARPGLRPGVAVLVTLTVMAASCSGAAREPGRAPPAAHVQLARRPAGPAAASLVPAQLLGVSCPRISTCLAVGDASAPAASVVVLAKQRDGAAWQAEQVPAPAQSAQPNAVSCAAPGECIAVGTSGVAQWTEGRWRTVLGSSSDGSPYLAVSCPARDWCMAVGSDPDSGQAVFGLWSDGAWRSGLMAQPPGAEGAVDAASVSCVSASFCAAVGGYSLSDAADQPLGYGRAFAEIWTGTTWQAPSTWAGSPATGSAVLSGVSCASAAACTAVGAGIGQMAPVAERWDGTGWTTQDTASSAESTAGQLNAVSCPAVTACIAVGSFDGAATAEIWNGSAWQLDQMPYAGEFSGLSAVSCPAASQCVAVGSAFPDGDSYCNLIVLVDVWNGSGWQSFEPWTDPDCPVLP
jgi:hypothetical protein